MSYKLSTAEAQLYKHITDYVRGEFNRAEALETGPLERPDEEKRWRVSKEFPLAPAIAPIHPSEVA